MNLTIITCLPTTAVAGVILARSVVDIREWIANRTFEDECKLRNRHGLDTGDRVQLVVKITYPDGVNTQSSTSSSLPSTVPGQTPSSLNNNTSSSSVSTTLPLYERYIHGLPSAKNPNEIPGTGGTNSTEKDDYPPMSSRDSMLSTGGSFRRPPLTKANSLERKGAPTPAVNAIGGVGIGLSGSGSFLERSFSNNDASNHDTLANNTLLNTTGDLMGVKSMKQRGNELADDAYPGNQSTSFQKPSHTLPLDMTYISLSSLSLFTCRSTELPTYVCSYTYLSTTYPCTSALISLSTNLSLPIAFFQVDNCQPIKRFKIF